MAEVESRIPTPVAVNAAPPGSPSPRGPIDHGRIEAQMRRWQDRVLDLTKSNPLIGLNAESRYRSRPDFVPALGAGGPATPGPLGRYSPLGRGKSCMKRF